MSLLHLPEEILLIIIKQLDLKTIISLYQTCKYFKHLICMPGVVQECRLSLNTMATSKTFKWKFFKDIAVHLKQLILCGVQDLCKSALLPALKKLKNLKTLDVSYTNITICDFVEVIENCPTIENIAINFVFESSSFDHHKRIKNILSLNVERLVQYQHSFRSLKNVHFVGSALQLLHSQIAFFILQNSELKSLKYSICEKISNSGSGKFYISCHGLFICKPVKFSEFSIYLLDNEKEYAGFNEFKVFSFIDLVNYEFLIIHVTKSLLNKSTFYASPLLEPFLSNQFDSDVECVTQLTNIVIGNAAIIFWDKESTEFDNKFYTKLLKQLKEYYVFNYDPRVCTSMPSKYNWYSIVPLVTDINKREDPKDLLFKKRRVAPPSLVMNYDELFKEKERIQLKVSFKYFLGLSVTLSSNSNYLSKLTFLSLNGDASYSVEFFHILFRCCEQLVTLNVVRSSSSSSVMSSLLRSIPLSKTLKNVRLVNKQLDFESIFSSFSQTKTLENIHLVATSRVHLSPLSDPSLLLRNCNNLYSIYIDALVPDSKKSTVSLFYKLRSRFGKNGLKIVIENHWTRDPASYSPYSDIFQIYTIKPPLSSLLK